MQVGVPEVSEEAGGAAGRSQMSEWAGKVGEWETGVAELMAESSAWAGPGRRMRTAME